MRYFFETAISMEKVIGPEGKFVFTKMGAWGETKKEAQDEVRQWIKEFVAECRAKKNRAKLEEEPFESVNPNRKPKQ